MSISISGDISAIKNQYATQSSADSKATALSSQLSNLQGASDEELMEACKSFESYLLEQVVKNVREALVPEDEEEEGNEYLEMFGDRLYQEYATKVSDSGQLGLTQQLFEAMKRDYGNNISATEVNSTAMNSESRAEE